MKGERSWEGAREGRDYFGGANFTRLAMRANPGQLPRVRKLEKWYTGTLTRLVQTALPHRLRNPQRGITTLPFLFLGVEGGGRLLHGIRTYTVCTSVSIYLTESYVRDEQTRAELNVRKVGKVLWYCTVPRGTWGQLPFDYRGKHGRGGNLTIKWV